MNSKQLLNLGVPLGEPMRRAFDFISAYCLKGGDKTRLAEEVKAIVQDPASFHHDPIRADFARALLAAPPLPRSRPAAYRIPDGLGDRPRP